MINNSWGCTYRCPTNPLAEDAVRFAESLGVVVVFAAGNADDDVAYYSPSNMTEVITVAASNELDQRADFSNWGISTHHFFNSSSLEIASKADSGFVSTSIDFSMISEFIQIGV